MESEQIRVLLVEDNPADARLVQEFLAESERDHFDIVWTQRLEEGKEQVESGEFDVVLLDLGLPGFSGHDTFDHMYFSSGDTPIGVLTGRSDEDLAVSALQVGAQDYLYKVGMSGDALARALRYAEERTRHLSTGEIRSILNREASSPIRVAKYSKSAARS